MLSSSLLSGFSLCLSSFSDIYESPMTIWMANSLLHAPSSAWSVHDRPDTYHTVPGSHRQITS